MPYSLKGRNVLVTAGSRGLGAVICERFAAEGANIVVNYFGSKDRAEQVVEACQKHGVQAMAVQADIGLAVDTVRLVQETFQQLGGLDVVVNNVGWTKFADFADLRGLTLDEWNKCWTVNVMSHLILMQETAPIFNSNPDGGVFLITSSAAGIRTLGSSMGYCVTKAAGLHLMKCLACTQGPKIRVNAVLPGMLLTVWSTRYSVEVIESRRQNAALKQEAKLDDCADAFVAAARNTSMTGQQIVVDSGLIIR